MDPQQKLVLHVGYLTFEQRHTQVSSLCAHHGGDFAMGIFVGVEPSGLQALERVSPFFAVTSRASSIASGRLSY